MSFLKFRAWLMPFCITTELITYFMMRYFFRYRFALAAVFQSES